MERGISTLLVLGSSGRLPNSVAESDGLCMTKVNGIFLHCKILMFYPASASVDPLVHVLAIISLAAAMP